MNQFEFMFTHIYVIVNMHGCYIFMHWIICQLPPPLFSQKYINNLSRHVPAGIVKWISCSNQNHHALKCTCKFSINFLNEPLQLICSILAILAKSVSVMVASWSMMLTSTSWCLCKLQTFNYWKWNPLLYEIFPFCLSPFWNENCNPTCNCRMYKSCWLQGQKYYLGYTVHGILQTCLAIRLVALIKDTFTLVWRNLKVSFWFFMFLKVSFWSFLLIFVS